ncbi:MAG TPA: tyrosine-type recombinase/integrase [Drouetiella sp.]
MKMTKTNILNLEYTGRSHCVYWDDQLPGLGIRVYPGGAKSWIVRYLIRGRKRFVVLGSVSILTIEDARARGRQTLLEALDSKDPNNVRNISVRAFGKEYLERWAKKRKRSWKEDERRLDLYIYEHWGKFQVAAIRRADVARLHSTIGSEFPYQANRVLEQVAKMWSLAKIWGYLPTDHPSVVDGIDPYEEEERDRYVTPEEMPLLLSAIYKESPQVAAYFHLLLLTGLRKNNLLQLAWADIDTTRREVKLSRASQKNKKARYLPLTDDAFEILQSLPKTSRWVFPGADQSKPRNNVNKAWKRILNRTGIEDLQIHDLRRTVGSYLAQSGYNIPLIGEVLGQTCQRATVIYMRYATSHVRSALNANTLIVRSLTPEILKPQEFKSV